jgi:cysteine desulfurase/selenocysteine lyase
MAHAVGAVVMVDGSQAAVHMPVNVAEIGCDFYCITGHKLYGPSGVGALYAKRERMEEMRPWHGGGDMIRLVAKNEVTYNDPPHKFEAGTPPIAQVIGLAEALRYMQGVGMNAIAEHERALRDYARERLDGLNWLAVQGQSETKGAIFSFTMEGAHAHDISTVLDRYGVAVRAGHHCCQPLMEHMGVNATCRASFGMYNSTEEVDVLVESLEKAHSLFA